MIHPLADCQSKNVGKGTTIWQFSVILEQAIIGEYCNVNCHTFIENDVILGDRVTVKSGVYLWDGLRVGDDVFIGPSVVFTNDLMPRSKRRVTFVPTILEEGCSIGAGSNILAGTKIGAYAMVGMGSNVVKDVPAYSIVYGNPAKVMGWLDESGEKLVQVEGPIWLSREGQEFKVIDNVLNKL